MAAPRAHVICMSPIHCIQHYFDAKVRSLLFRHYFSSAMGRNALCQQVGASWMDSWLAAPRACHTMAVSKSAMAAPPFIQSFVNDGHAEMRCQQVGASTTCMSYACHTHVTHSLRRVHPKLLSTLSFVENTCPASIK